MALFAGRAAGSLARESREWKKLWMQEEQAERQYDLAQEQMSHARQLQTDQQQFQQRMTDAQEAFQLGLLDRRELWDMSELAVEMMPQMSLEQQWSQVEALEGLGSPLGNLARNTVRTTLFNNFDDAVTLVDSVFTAPLGTPFNRAFVEMAADQVIARSGMDGQRAEDFRADLMTALTQRGEEREEWDGLQFEGARTALNQARADVADTISRTEYTDAQTESVFQDIAIRDEQREVVLASMETQLRILGLDEAQLEIYNGNLPAQLSAELAHILATTEGIENQNELYHNTAEYLVRKIAAETGVSEEQARHLVATGPARDAAIRGELDLLKATIAHTHATTDHLGVQSEAMQVQMQEARVAMATTLVEHGRADMLAAVADDLFGDLGLSDEAQAGLVESLQRTANSRMTNREKLDSAAVGIALAEQKHGEWKARTAEDQRTFDNFVEGRKLGQVDRSLDQTDEEIGLNMLRVGQGDRDLDLRERGLDSEIELGWEGVRQADERIEQGWDELGFRREVHDDDVRLRADGLRLDAQRVSQGWMGLDLEGRRLGQQDRALDLQEWAQTDASERGWEGLRIQELGVQAEMRRVDGWIASLNAPGPEAAPLTSNETHRAVFDSLRISTGDLQRLGADVSAHGVAMNQLESAVTLSDDGSRIEGIAGSTPQEIASNQAKIQALASRYGIDLVTTEGGLDGAAVQLHTLITMEEDTARLAAQGSTLAYIREWAALTRQLPTAQQLGFQAGDPIFTQAMRRVPGMYAHDQVTDVVRARATDLAQSVAPHVGPGGSFAGANEAYEVMQETFTQEELDRADYPTVVEFAGEVARQSEAYHSAANIAQSGADLMSAAWGQEYDLESADDRRTLDTHLGAQYNTVAGTDSAPGFLDRLQRLPGTSFADVWTGRQDTEAQRENVRLGNTIQHTLGDALPEGLIDPATGRIENQAGLQQFLVHYQHALAQQRQGLQEMDGLLRGQ